MSTEQELRDKIARYEDLLTRIDTWYKQGLQLVKKQGIGFRLGYWLGSRPRWKE